MENGEKLNHFDLTAALEFVIVIYFLFCFFLFNIRVLVYLSHEEEM